MSKEEIEVFKNLIAKVDYYLEKGEVSKLNEELNSACKYILRKEGFYRDEINEVPLNQDILSGYVHKPKAELTFSNYLIPTMIPNTKYDFYRKQWGN